MKPLLCLCLMFCAVAVQADDNLMVSVPSRTFDSVTYARELTRLNATLFKLTAAGSKIPKLQVERWGHAMQIALQDADWPEQLVLLGIAFYWQQRAAARNPTATFHLERRGVELEQISLARLHKLYAQVLYRYGLTDSGSDDPQALLDIWKESDEVK